MFEVRIQDNRINAYRVIKGQTRQDVELKAAAQIAIWNEKARHKQERDEAQLQKQATLFEHYEGVREAEELAEEAKSKILSLETLLLNLVRQSIPSWNDFQDSSPFPEARPRNPDHRTTPKPPVYEIFQPKFTFFDRLLSSKRREKERDAEDEFTSAMASWEKLKTEIELANLKLDEQARKETLEWEQKREQYVVCQRVANDAIEQLRKGYAEGSSEAVEFKSNEALARTELPEGFPQGSDVSYAFENRTLIVDFELPNQSILPEYREVKYVRSKSELSFKPLPETWKRTIYDLILYQSALGLVYRLFRTDSEFMIHSIVFNGWVHSVDRTTGADTHGCILSLQAGRDEFMPLDLNRVDPKACFRSLKGVASSKLIELTPIKPIQQLNKKDSRFVAGYSVIEMLDERTNLAAMDWQDFENLIREVFQQEFSHNGGEVRITQASRDGGVDAVAFDPDPIRGGKIVIQAKRYVNTVGVSAVRDLYGTVQHEGAMKGILVTTATYGQDAYEFAKDKPLTLISGGELLRILERHGHSAKINLTEARALRL